ncbi:MULTISPECIES: META domain-containing protein [unclassified Paracoccus (in: a-proteobacteria)]|uniref:META domain-containing protein n=1 Tax=unclassified Paracoccus (in: a-proteobacteria) TaxID=2688777 RepID=UPI0012B245BE|nr:MULTISPECIES: META domain-containing protein [unclassified Paracoccus (in: a-proteobacteria)]UXU74924.1 META domain-containing protein [Paracoccus sp. SMMA_5]UXU80827.1 META domain-containing protein [Paracoccus sp. SMMA_5_TC]
MRKMLMALSLPLAFGLAGCSEAEDKAAALVGDYDLIAIEGVTVSGKPTFSLAADGAVSGQGPCNNYMGKNRATLPALDLGALATTRRACIQEGGENAFFDALAAVREARREGDELIMTGPEVTIRWRAVSR